MNIEFLHKIVKQLVLETQIDYISGSRPMTLTMLNNSSLIVSFTGHCKKIYGLNDIEVILLWDKYSKMLCNKMNKIIKEGAGGDSEIRSVK